MTDHACDHTCSTEMSFSVESRVMAEMVWNGTKNAVKNDMAWNGRKIKPSYPTSPPQFNPQIPLIMRGA